MTEVRKRQDQSVDPRVEGTLNTEPNDAANMLQTNKWSPSWLWAVFGLMVVSTLIIGLLFGGDGNYS
jgi:hypothetical protein